MRAVLEPQTVTVTSYSAFIPSHKPEAWAELGFDKRWPHFSFDELKCKGSGSLVVHFATMDALEALRNMVRRPIVVNSYYRSPAYNAKVKGAEASRHLVGMAVDTPLWAGSTEGRASMLYYAAHAGFRGFGIYPSFTHLDTGPHRVWEQISTDGD